MLYWTVITADILMFIWAMAHIAARRTFRPHSQEEKAEVAQASKWTASIAGTIWIASAVYLMMR